LGLGQGDDIFLVHAIKDTRYPTNASIALSQSTSLC
jgi:hypothetical protein